MPVTAAWAPITPKTGSLVHAGLQAALNAEVETLTEGVVEPRKAPSQAWAVGARIDWDKPARLATTVVASNTLIGAGTEPVAGGATIRSAAFG